MGQRGLGTGFEHSKGSQYLLGISCSKLKTSLRHLCLDKTPLRSVMNVYDKLTIQTHLALVLHLCIINSLLNFDRARVSKESTSAEKNTVET